MILTIAKPDKSSIILSSFADVAQLVEHLIRNEGVTGSNPVVGSSSWIVGGLVRVVPEACFLLLFIFKHGVGQIYSPAHYTSEKISAIGEG